jgi:hypothetical protein
MDNDNLKIEILLMNLTPNNVHAQKNWLNLIKKHECSKVLTSAFRHNIYYLYVSTSPSVGNSDKANNGFWI